MSWLLTNGWTRAFLLWGGFALTGFFFFWVFAGKANVPASFMRRFDIYRPRNKQGGAWSACLALLAVTSFAGCATGISESFACPELVAYSADFQKQAASEFDALPDGSPLAMLIEDYLHLRDRIRSACRSQ